MAKKKEKEEKKGKAKASPKLEKLVSEIEKLSVLELSELVGVLQERLGVTPAPAAPAPAPAGAAPEPEGEKPAKAATQTVVLADAGENKIAVIKALREVKPDLGLKEAKDITEATPKEILIDVKAEEAEEAKKKLEGAGAKVELK